MAKKTKKQAINAVTYDWRELEDFPEFKNDRDVVLAAITDMGQSIEHASDELRSDRELAMIAVQNTSHDSSSITQSQGDALEYLEKFQDDKELVLMSVIGAWSALEFASEKLRIITIFFTFWLWGKNVTKRNDCLGI